MMNKFHLKAALTDLVYSITVHSFSLFWAGIGFLLLGCFGLVVSGATSNVLTEVGGYMFVLALALEVGKAIFNKIIWKQFV